MIKLDENYRIESDVNNFILKYETENGIINEKTGKVEISRNEWYFPTIGHCLNKYMNESLKEPDSIVGLLKEIQRLEQLISSYAFKL